MSTYVLPDIHGCSLELGRLLRLLSLMESDTIICLGDYIDRGTDSKGVIEILMDLHCSDIQTVFLRGNHEELLLNCLLGSMDDIELWLSNGGEQTLRSYGVSYPDELPHEHLEFIKSLFRMNCALCDENLNGDYRYSSVVNGLCCWLCRLEISQDYPYPYRERNYFQRAAEKTCVDEITLRKRYLIEVLKDRAHETNVDTNECWLQLKALLEFQKSRSVSSNENETAFQRLLIALERNSVGVDLP